jgi:chromate transporter
MLDGLGLAETTPGPLIMVLQFVGFLGGWKYAAPLSPLAGATLGAFITTWATFAPSFLFIFAGAPYIEQMRTLKELTAALSAVTAAVVGVILNLALWFGRETLVPPGSINVFGIIIAAAAFAALQWGKRDIIPIVGVAALLGLLAQVLGWI